VRSWWGCEVKGEVVSTCEVEGKVVVHLRGRGQDQRLKTRSWLGRRDRNTLTRSWSESTTRERLWSGYSRVVIWGWQRGRRKVRVNLGLA